MVESLIRIFSCYSSSRTEQVKIFQVEKKEEESRKKVKERKEENKRKWLGPAKQIKIG